MFEEDIFKDAKYCVTCNKFYVTDHCPFCTPKKESRVESQELGVKTLNSGLKTQDSQLKTQNPQLDSPIKTFEDKSKVEELSSEIERLRRENKEKKEQLAKEKELELKFNILADKFERLSQKEKEHRNNIIYTPPSPPSQGGDRGGVDIKIKRSKGDNGHFVVRDNEKDAQTKLLKERINELNAELEQLQQRNEKKDLQMLQSTAEASKLSGVVEQQKDELERLRFDIQDRDRVIMQISLTLSNAISQALTQREVGAGFKPTPTKELTTPHPFDARPTTKQDKHSRKVFYALLGGLNAAIIGYLGFAILYKKGIVNLIIEFFKGHM